MLRLRQWQTEALNAWIQNRYRGIVVAPTGTGKSYVGLGAIKKMGYPSLIVVPTERLLKTWDRRVRRVLRVPPSPFYGKEKRLGWITISIYNTMARNLWLLKHFKLVILDEIHHSAARTWIKIVESLDGQPVLGLTATIERLDNGHLKILEKIPIVYNFTLSEAMESHQVAECEVIDESVPLTMAEYSEYARIDQMLRKLRARASHGLESMNPDLEARFYSLIQRRKAILAEAVLKLPKLLEIVQKHLDERILVFSESIKSIEEAKKYLIKHGIPCETYHSKKTENERDRIFQAWGNGYKVLLACRALDEGIDVPEAKIGIILATGQTKRQLIQRLGRLLRPNKNKKAKIYIISARATLEQNTAPKIKQLTATT